MVEDPFNLEFDLILNSSTFAIADWARVAVLPLTASVVRAAMPPAVTSAAAADSRAAARAATSLLAFSFGVCMTLPFLRRAATPARAPIAA